VVDVDNRTHVQQRFDHLSACAREPHGVALTPMVVWCIPGIRFSDNVESPGDSIMTVNDRATDWSCYPASLVSKPETRFPAALFSRICQKGRTQGEL
jgi:hypothetical protein